MSTQDKSDEASRRNDIPGHSRDDSKAQGQGGGAGQASPPARSDLVLFDGRPPAFNQRAIFRPDGGLYAYDQDTGEDLPDLGGDTRMCVHCQKHWVVKPGSGRSRGFCFNCNGVTCGKQKCETECTYFEKALEIKEERDRQMRIARGDLTL